MGKDKLKSEEEKKIEDINFLRDYGNTCDSLLNVQRGDIKKMITCIYYVEKKLEENNIKYKKRNFEEYRKSMEDD